MQRSETQRRPFLAMGLRGPKPGKGFRPPGSGRPPGQPNHVTVELRKLCQTYTAEAVRRLAEMGGLVEGVPPAEPAATQLGALRELLDRAHGKAVQPIGNDDGEPIIVEIVRYADVAATRQPAHQENAPARSQSFGTFYSP
jgi:hypothetical protein